jgi:hypothetical protein
MRKGVKRQIILYNIMLYKCEAKNILGKIIKH